ncbi:XTP/dITP diphosphatase [bacterium]|nr:XTP/dITP diphosphatase [bacterium]
MISLVLATRNRHKVEELSAMLRELPVRVLSFHDFPDMPDVVEDGATLTENAIKKASEVASFTGLPALADDTGLEVDALDGAPGVRSARFAGEPSNWEENNSKLLSDLSGIEGSARAAAFRCVVALAMHGDEEVRTVEGVTHGVILEAARGEGGFGYDPLFLPDGHELTYAEMRSDEKNAVSHRGKAIKNARALIAALLDAS